MHVHILLERMVLIELSSIAYAGCRLAWVSFEARARDAGSMAFMAMAKCNLYIDYIPHLNPAVLPASSRAAARTSLQGFIPLPSKATTPS